jgi:hypothetical protein
MDLPWLDNVVRAKRPQRLPVVLTRAGSAGANERRVRTDGQFALRYRNALDGVRAPKG